MHNLRIDIVSDIVCPWCVVGYRQLDQALQQSGTQADIHWHPFELNPDMPQSGQNLTEHICEKYGMDKAQSEDNRQQLVSIGNTLGFTFAYDESSRMLNTFKAHQLLHWAGLHDREHELKQALFTSYFTEQQDISDEAVLADAAANVGLDRTEALKTLQSEIYASVVRQRESHWTNQGIRGVPAMIVNEKYLLSGAQGVDNYLQMIAQLEAAIGDTKKIGDTEKSEKQETT